MFSAKNAIELVTSVSVTNSMNITTSLLENIPYFQVRFTATCLRLTATIRKTWLRLVGLIRSWSHPNGRAHNQQLNWLISSESILWVNDNSISNRFFFKSSQVYIDICNIQWNYQNINNPLSFTLNPRKRYSSNLILYFVEVYHSESICDINFELVHIFNIISVLWSTC